MFVIGILGATALVIIIDFESTVFIVFITYGCMSEITGATRCGLKNIEITVFIFLCAKIELVSLKINQRRHI